MAIILLSNPLRAQKIDLLNPLHFTQDDGLPSASIYGICQDGDGRIWIGTENGLCYLENGSFHKVNNPELPAIIYRVYSTGDSILYVVGDLPPCIIKMTTSGRILSKYRSPDVLFGPLLQFSASEEAIYFSNWKSIIRWTEEGTDTLGHIIGSNLQSISLTPSGGVLINKMNGLYTLKNGQEKLLSSEQSPISLVSKEGDTLIFNTKGIYRYRHGQYETVHSRPTSTYHPPANVLRDNTGVFWIGGRNAELYLATEEFGIDLAALSGLSKTQFSAIYQDTDGNVWCGTNGNGLILFKKSLFSMPIELFSFKNTNVINVFSAGKQTFISNTHGLFVLTSQNQWLEVPITYRRQRQTNIRTGVEFDSTIVIGGLLNMNDGLWPIELHEGLTANFTYATALAVFDNTLFIGCSGHFGQIRAHQMRNCHLRAAVVRNPVPQYSQFKDFCQVDSGVISSTLNSLLYLPKGDSIFQPMPMDYDDTRSYPALGKASDGSLWCASSRGLLRWQDNLWVQVHLPDFDDNQPLRALIIDKQNRIWFGGDRGLYMYQNGQILHYTYTNGLPSSVIKCLYYEELEDILWVGTTEGIVKADIGNLPSQLRFDQEIVFKNLNVYNGESFSSLSSVNLESNENSFEVEFGPQNHFAPLPITYRYRLNGLANEWKVTTEPWAGFQQLSPGEHILEVQAKTSGSLWSNSGQLNFTILLPFWKKWEFFLGIALVLVALVTTINILRVKRIRRSEENRRKLDQKIVELEYRALSAGMNPHFIFNALNSIQQFIIPLQSREALEYLGDVSNLIRLNMQALGKRVVSLADELNLIELYFRIENHRLQDRLHLKLINKLWSDPKLISIPPLLIQPLVENAIWHGLSLLEKGGEIRITLTETEDFVEIEVSDNGIGLEAAAKNRKKHHESVGLNTTEERLNHHHHKNKFKIEEVLDPKGIVLGTRACFRLYK